MNNNACFEEWMAALHAKEQRIAPIWQMTADERVEAMYAGRMSREQCDAWARRCPDEVPTLNGEWWFIAITTPEIADADDHDTAKPSERHLSLVPDTHDAAKTAAGEHLRHVA